MKKYIVITLLTGLVLGFIIVDTMAGYSDLTSINRSDTQEVRVDIDDNAKMLIDNSDDGILLKSNSDQKDKGSVPASMLMIGLTLVGLASFRGGFGNQGNGRSE